MITALGESFQGQFFFRTAKERVRRLSLSLNMNMCTKPYDGLIITAIILLRYQPEC